MAKHTDDFRGGNYAEYLTQFVFSTIGFVAPIPRQEDFFLSDLFVHLHAADRTGERPGYVPMGQSFTVQVKSNEKTIALTESETVLVVERAAIPWFVAVRPRGDDTIKLYSTIDRHLWRNQPHTSRKLVFNDRPTTWSTGDKIPNAIAIGPPISTVSIKDLVADDKDDSVVRRKLWAVVGTWAWADALNIGLSAKRIPLFLRPQELPEEGFVDPDHLEPILLEANPDIAALAGAVGESMIALRELLDKHSIRTEHREWFSELVEMIEELSETIKEKL